MATTASIESKLDAIGDKRRKHKRLRTEARDEACRVVPLAVEAEVPISEIARRTDMGRDSVYAILREAEGQASASA